jgi:hypothetical protein
MLDEVLKSRKLLSLTISNGKSLETKAPFSARGPWSPKAKDTSKKAPIGLGQHHRGSLGLRCQRPILTQRLQLPVGCISSGLQPLSRVATISRALQISNPARPTNSMVLQSPSPTESTINMKLRHKNQTRSMMNKALHISNPARSTTSMV